MLVHLQVVFIVIVFCSIWEIQNLRFECCKHTIPQYAYISITYILYKTEKDTSFSFSLSFSHPNINTIETQKIIVAIEKIDFTIFRGRIPEEVWYFCCHPYSLYRLICFVVFICGGFYLHKGIFINQIETVGLPCNANNSSSLTVPCV